MGCDSVEMYGGDKEFTNSLNKNAICPFDLLRMLVTDEIADLWNESLLPQKVNLVSGLPEVLKALIDEYFA